MILPFILFIIQTDVPTESIENRWKLDTWILLQAKLPKNGATTAL